MPTMTIDQAFRLAIEHHAAGRLRDAESIYRQILAVAPNHADSLHLLGLLTAQAGQPLAGTDLIRRAIALAPNEPVYHLNLGNILNTLGQFDAAIDCCQRALALKSDLAEAHYNLGNAFQAKGQLDDAIACFRRTVQCKSDYVEGHNNLGNALSAKGQLDNAIASYRQALKLRPDATEVHNNLGNAWKEKGQLAEAIASYQRALEVNPAYVEAHYNLANAWLITGKLDAAIACYQRTLELRPAFAEACNNLGSAWKEKGCLDDAMACYRRTLELRPDSVEAHNNLGNAWKDKGQLDQAMACYQQALSFNPAFRAAHDNVLYLLPYLPASDLQSQFDEICRWNQQYAQPLKPALRPHGNSREEDRPLRIGYVSPDFRSHPVGRFILPLLTNHLRQKFEVFCYTLSPVTDDLTEQLRSHADHWQTLFGVSDEAAAEMIRQDRIDVLVDLAMHTAGNRILIFARKPAPVQVTYLAYAGGTGVDAIDYRLTDRYLDPDESTDRFFLERSFRLSGTYWCYQQSFDTPETSPPPAFQRGHVTFGCLNNFCKVNAQVMEAWAGLLRRVADSRLLLHCPEGNHRDGLRQFFIDGGIAAERVEILGRQSEQDYFKAYQQMDIALDPFPYGGGTTTCDALWMGVPVVTLAGRTPVGRSGVSILTTLGHEEWIAQTADQYTAIAANLAGDSSRLSNLRKTLRQQMRSSSLMDAAQFARHIESAYRTMWRQWCAQPTG